MSETKHGNNSFEKPKPVCFHKGGPLVYELVSHLPFSISSVTIGLILAGVICFVAPARDGHDDGGSAPETPAVHGESAPAHESEHDHEGHQEAHGHGHAGTFALFHLFHPAHMLFSAAATAAMFRRYDRSVIKAVFVGLTGAIVVCGISDILMPHISAGVLGRRVPLHVCIIEHPMLVIPHAFVGVVLGLLAAEGVSASTFFSHSLHVFTSSMASIFYLVASIGQTAWFDQIGLVFLFVVLAVMLPCCVSDIVFPLMMTRKARTDYATMGHHH